MTLTFTLALSLLLTHELDAMRAREWRIFPGLSKLKNETGRQAFVFLHVPLFAVVLGGLAGGSSASWVYGLNVFCVAHVVAHALMHKHPQNGFRNVGSWILIGGAGVAGALDLLRHHM